jgi:hypothetical protein
MIFPGGGAFIWKKLRNILTNKKFLCYLCVTLKASNVVALFGYNLTVS